ncbi:MAG: PIN domain-containing protein, partial [Acidimicrobiia bacterium]|nr:PIN domain-containing protein [Acidimicrobiia bacterium]
MILSPTGESNPKEINQVASTYVLDTCVLLADPYSLLQFDEHDVVLPLVVVEELDRKKTGGDEVGANARAAIRLLEDLGASESGGLREPVPLPTGGSLRIELNGVTSDRLPVALDPSTPDHRILATCLNLEDGDEAVLVTKDAALRIKGAQLGVAVQDYRGDTVPVEQIHSGLLEQYTDDETIDRLYDAGKLEIGSTEAAVNEFLVLKSGASKSALARVIQTSPTTVVERMPTHVRAFGVEPKNVRQTVALHQLLDPDIPAVSLMGMAGTGKTFLSLAAALEQVLEQGRYRRVSVYRPLVAVGRQEVGYLPGDLTEKLA